MVLLMKARSVRFLLIKARSVRFLLVKVQSVRLLLVKALLMLVAAAMMMSSCGYTLKPNRGDIVGTVGTTAPSSEPAISEPVVAPVTEAVRKKVMALIGVVYPLSPDLIVEVEGGIEVEGAPAYGVYVGSPNEMTTTTMELFAVNIETNHVYLMDRVSGQYGLIASVPHMDGIDLALETIMSSPKESSNSGDYLEAHPEDVQTILDIGDEALPYLMSIHDNGDRGLRGVLALELATRIHNGLNIVSTVSPDGRFRVETHGVRIDITAAGIYPAEGIRLMEQDTGKVRWSMVPGYFRASFLWSPDSRFVAVYYEARTEGGTILLDTETMEPVNLPTMEALQKETGDNITPRSFRPDPYYEATRWVDDHVVEIGFRWVSEKEQDVDGTFCFDVIQQTTSNISVRFQ